MKICFFIKRYAPIFSGAAIAIERGGPYLKKQGVDFFVISYRFKGLSAYEVIDGVRIYRISPWLPGRLGNVIFNIKSAFMILRLKNEFDILHVYSIAAGKYAAMLVARILGKKTVFEMTLVGSDDPESIAQHSLLPAVEMRFFRMFDRYFAISEALAASYERMEFPKEKLWRLAKGIDTSRFAPQDDKGPVRRELGLPESGRLVCFIGAVMKRKGVDLLIDAWQRVAEQDSEAVLVIIGPDTFDEVQSHLTAFVDQTKEIVKRSLEGRVIFTGMTDKVEYYLKASDIFVFPSRAEGLGFVVLEAMSCGLPCVLTRLEGITEQIIGEGECGVVVPQGDTGALAEALLSLLRDPERAAEMGRNARERALKLFSVERATEQLIDYYKKMLSEKR